MTSDGAARLESDALLAAPRGRRMLAELVGHREVPSWTWSTPRGHGSTAAFGWHEGRAVPPWPTPRPPEHLAADLATLVRERLNRVSDPAAVCHAVAASVDAAMPWQEPDGDNRLLAHPTLVEALRPLAEALCASPVADLLTRPLAVGHQRLPLFPHAGDGLTERDPGLAGLTPWAHAWHEHTVDGERNAARTTPEDPSAPYSGEWWSTPTGPFPHAGSRDRTRPRHPWRAPVTTPPLPEWGALGAAELVWQEDSPGHEESVLLPVAPTREPRVYEITGPAAWADLVRRAPLVVTASRRHDWFRYTGRAGTWLIPDWLAVREEYDAVHVTAAGYLTTAGLAVETGDGAASVLAGWAPEATAWLTDSLEATGPTQRWRWIDQADTADAGGEEVPDHGWRRA